MFKKLLSLALAGLLLNVVYATPASAKTKAEKEAEFAERVRAGIAKLGTGAEARVEVKLRDKRKLKGYVSEAGAESFTVVDEKTGAATQVAYPQVGKVKGNNLSENQTALIVVGIFAAVLVATILVLK